MNSGIPLEKFPIVPQGHHHHHEDHLAFICFISIHVGVRYALPDGTRTRADLAVVAERVLILPSTTLPSSPEETYTHIHGPAEVPSFEKILPLRWDSNPLASGPRPRSTFSDSHAATEPPGSSLVFVMAA
jgi:hypothetical protein